MLYIAGNFVGKVSTLPATIRKLKYVKLLGKISNSDLPRYERAADVFLFTHLNPPCPNNVIESLACGLPVCGVADGAMPELVKQNEQGLLMRSPGTGFWITRQYDTIEFAQNIAKIIQNKKHYRKKCREIAETRYSLNEMIQQYVKVFGDITR